MSTINSDILAHLFTILSKKIIVPSDYHSQVAAVKEMLKDDMTGFIGTLTNFSINSASVNYAISSENDELTKILNKWLCDINKAYMGKIPSGVNALAEEYFKERWQSSSFPVLKIAKWEAVKELILPTKMFFVDGEYIHAEDKDNADGYKKLLNYNYYLGTNSNARSNYPLDDNVIFTRPHSRWFDEYPVPYLIKNGVYHNWKIIQGLKDKQSTILEQVIPYVFLIKKGSELLDQQDKDVKDEDLKKVVTMYKELIKKAKQDGKAPVRGASWDEELKHFIPDLKNIFEPDLFAAAEKNVLAGMGFIDIAEAVSNSRSESTLNPKPFIEEVKKGVKDFKQLIKEVVNLIISKNIKHSKYMNSAIYISSSPVTAFNTDKFRTLIRSLFKAGRVSNQTLIEVGAELDYSVEKHRIVKEKEENLDEKFYPPVTENQEGKGIDLPNKKIDKDDLPDDKTDNTEKREYKISSDNLVTAPYKNLKELPKNVKKLSKKKQRTFRSVWNKTYYWALGKGKSKEQAEKLAFRVAYSAIK